MSNTGKLLERFVEQIERIHLPQGTSVKPNEKVFNDEGVQIAEFDLEIEGKIGTTNFKWLIECRDRPSEGSAPASWIEQLVGRRSRFNFDKVIAVSTTGFAEGAKNCAEESGIEIRTVTETNIEQIRDWFLMDEITVVDNNIILKHFSLLIDENESKDTKNALIEILKGNNHASKILLSTQTGNRISVMNVFNRVCSENEASSHNPSLADASEKIELQIDYPKDDSHYVIETNQGNIRIRKIIFRAEKVKTEKKIPIASIKKYASMSTGDEISDTVNYNFDIGGSMQEMSVHNVKETGETIVTIKASKPKD